MEKISLSVKHLFWISVVFLVSYALLGLLAYPAVDDYDYARKAIEKGFWNTWVYEYLNWNGRYIATAILSFNPLTWKMFDLYHLIPSFLILGLLAGTCSLFNELFNGVTTKQRSYQYAFIFVFLFLYRHFTLEQDLYWMAGSITYTLPITFYSFGLSHMLKYLRTSKGLEKFTHLVVAIVSAFILIGSNETIMVIWNFTLLSAIIYQWVYSKKFNSGLAILFIFSLIFSFSVLLAPGNSVRSNRYLKSHDFFRTVGNSITYTLVYSIKFLSPPFVIFLVLNKKLVQGLKSKYQLLTPNKKNLRFICFVWFGVMFLTMAPSLWGMGRRPNDRTLASSIYFYYLLFPVFAYQILYRSPKVFRGFIDWFRRLPKHVITATFFVSLLMYNNFELIYGALFQFKDYKEFMVQRHQSIEGRAGQVVKLKAYPYEKRPYLLIFKDIDTGTVAFRDYFKLKDVIITNPEEAKER